MYQKLAVAAVVALLAVACVHASVEEVFSKSDAARVKDTINAAQKDGWWGDLESTHYAVSSLKAIGSPVPGRDKVCAAVAKAVGAAAKPKVADLYHAIAAAESMSCDNVPITEAMKATLQAGLSSDNLNAILNALAAVEAGAGRKKLSIADFDVTSVASRVMEMSEDDESGLSFLASSSADSDTANMVNAGRAMSILGSVYRARHELDNSLAAHVRSLTGEKLKALFRTGTAKGVDFATNSEESGLVAASTVLAGVSSLAASLSEKLSVPDHAIDDVCDFLVENKYAQSLEDVYFLVNGLRICSDNNLRVPLVLTVLPAANAGSAPTQVRVTNVFDEFAVKSKVVLVKATSDGDDDESSGSTVVESLTCDAASSDASNVVYNIAPASKAAWAANFYLLKFTVTPAGGASERFETERISRRIKVSAAYTPAKVELYTAESAKGAAEGKTESVSYPKSGPTVSVAAGKFIHARITFDPPSARPAQVFIILSPETAKAGNRKQSIHVAAAVDGHYALKVDLGSAEVADALSGNGKYSAELFVGDSLLSKPVSWRVATFDISGLPAAPSAAAAKAAVDFFAAKPDIAHAFRADEVRPNKLIALIFTVIVVLPLGNLLLQLMGTKLNLQFPSDAAELFQATVFQGLILAILFVNVLYWLGLTIFQALIMVGLLAPFAVWFGHGSLKALHTRKLNEKAAAIAAAAASGAPLSTSS